MGSDGEIAVQMKHGCACAVKLCKKVRVGYQLSLVADTLMIFIRKMWSELKAVIRVIVYQFLLILYSQPLEY